MTFVGFTPSDDPVTVDNPVIRAQEEGKSASRAPFRLTVAPIG
jgi:hypothetical protein